MTQQIKTWQVTWTAYDDKCVHEETIKAVTKTEAKSIIRWRKLANQTEIKDIEVKEAA